MVHAINVSLDLPSLHCVVMSVDEDDDDAESEAAEVRVTTAASQVERQHAPGLSANQQPPLSAGVQPSAPPTHRPSEALPTTPARTKSPAPSPINQAPPLLPLPTTSSGLQV